MSNGFAGWIEDNFIVLVPMLAFTLGGWALLQFTTFYGPGIILLSIGLGILIGVKEIKAGESSPSKDGKSDNPEYGVLSIWGRFSGKVRGPGYYLTANFFPFFITYSIVESKPVNKDFDQDMIDIPTNGEAHPNSDLEVDAPTFTLGAIGQVEWGVTLVPDENDDGTGNTRLIQFIRYGGIKGVLDVLEDAGNQYFMALGRKNHWRKLVSSPNEIAQHLIEQFTGQKMARGETSQQFTLRMSREKFPDLNGWGIRFLKINVWRFRVEKKIEEAAIKNQVELMQRQSEMTEAETLKLLVQKYKEAFPSLSDDQIKQAIQVERRKGTQAYVDGNLAGGIVLQNTGGSGGTHNKN